MNIDWNKTNRKLVAFVFVSSSMADDGESERNWCDCDRASDWLTSPLAIHSTFHNCCIINLRRGTGAYMYFILVCVMCVFTRLLFQFYNLFIFKIRFSVSIHRGMAHRHKTNHIYSYVAHISSDMWWLQQHRIQFTACISVSTVFLLTHFFELPLSQRLLVIPLIRYISHVDWRTDGLMGLDKYNIDELSWVELSWCLSVLRCIRVADWAAWALYLRFDSAAVRGGHKPWTRRNSQLQGLSVCAHVFDLAA